MLNKLKAGNSLRKVKKGRGGGGTIELVGVAPTDTHTHPHAIVGRCVMHKFENFLILLFSFTLISLLAVFVIYIFIYTWAWFIGCRVFYFFILNKCCLRGK